MTGACSMLSLAEDYLAERRALGFDLQDRGPSNHRLRSVRRQARPQRPAYQRDRPELGAGPGQAGQPELLGPTPRSPSPVREVFGAARSRHRVPPDSRSLVVHTAALRRTSTRTRRSATLWPLRPTWPPTGGLRPATYATIFGLIAATGLRRSEALHLHCGDVDLDERFLTVRNTKFRKSRHVPIHPPS